MTNHPITPPPELVRQWSQESEDEHQPTVARSMVGLFATKAARWAADQELEACCEYIRQWFAAPQYRIAELRAARRPKPPSLKEQALSELNLTAGLAGAKLSRTQVELIRRALEAL